MARATMTIMPVQHEPPWFQQNNKSGSFNSALSLYVLVTGSVIILLEPDCASFRPCSALADMALRQGHAHRSSSPAIVTRLGVPKNPGTRMINAKAFTHITIVCDKRPWC